MKYYLTVLLCLLLCGCSARQQTVPGNQRRKKQRTFFPLLCTTLTTLWSSVTPVRSRAIL